MDIKIQIIIVVAVIIGFTLLVNMIRRNKLELKYALSWFMLGFGVLLFGVFPNLTVKLSKMLGIGTPVNALFFVGFCFSLIVIFSLTVAVSRLSKKVKRLVQELGLLQAEKGEEHE